MTTHITLILINIFALICSFLWLYFHPDWEPILTSLGFISSLIALLYNNISDTQNKTTMKQSGKSSNNYQAAGDININYSSKNLDKHINPEIGVLWFNLGQESYIFDKFIQIRKEAFSRGTILEKDRSYLEYETRVKKMSEELKIKPHNENTENCVTFYANQSDRINEFFMYLGMQVIKYLFAQTSQKTVGKDFSQKIKDDCLKEIRRLFIELNLSDSLSFVNSNIQKNGDFNPDELSTIIRGDIRKNYK